MPMQSVHRAYKLLLDVFLLHKTRMDEFDDGGLLQRGDLDLPFNVDLIMFDVFWKRPR